MMRTKFRPVKRIMRQPAQHDTNTNIKEKQVVNEYLEYSVEVDVPWRKKLRSALKRTLV